MSCTSYSPCHEPTCNDCSPINACYDNCGCLNPTTFQCITNTLQNYPNIPFNINQHGGDFLSQLNATINGIQSNLYKVRVDDSDTCPDTLFDKIEAGSENINISVTGSGCERKLVLTVGEGVGEAGADIYAAVSSNDTTPDYLTNKFTDGTFIQKSVVNPGGDEQIRFDILLSNLLSTDSGNQLGLGTDNKLKTLYTAPDGSETKLSVAIGSGLTLTGTGTTSTPFVLGTNGPVFRVRTYFDGVWKPLTFSNVANPSVTLNNQSAQYRLRYDGTIEFRGTITYTTAFSGATGNKVTLTNACTFPTGGGTNLPLAEVNKVVNLKSFSTFDSPSTIDSAPSINGYNVNMNSNQISVELFSNTSGSKTISITLDGAQYHPSI